MNFLAHAYLSFGIPEITVGNLISDFVKGTKKYDYPIDVQQGIALHRAIDSFTDSHEATKKAKEVFRPAYRLYSAPITDVVFDHFLAIDKNEFTDDTLFDFSLRTYAVIENYQSLLPPGFAHMFPYMKSQNWLYRYRTKQGIENSLRGLVRRSAYLTESQTAFLLFEGHFEKLQSCYQELIAELKPYAKQRMAELIGH